ILVQAVIFTCIAFSGCGRSASGEGPGGEARFAEVPGESLTNTDNGNFDDAPAGATGDPIGELTTSPEVAIAPPTNSGEGIDLSITIIPSGGSAGTGGGSSD